MKISTVDEYLTTGCGRCDLWNTPQCRVHDWKPELELLRKIVLETGLVEEIKWGQPTYCFEQKNVVLFSALRDGCAISFFKGSLLKDPQHILTATSENMQSARLIKFTTIEQIQALESQLKAFIQESIENEKLGLKVNYKQTSDYPVPEEFQNILEELPQVKAAFDALTPGRQRGYLLFFAAPKQSKTRVSRIEKCIPLILAGKGLND